MGWNHKGSKWLIQSLALPGNLALLPISRVRSDRIKDLMTPKVLGGLIFRAAANTWSVNEGQADSVVSWFVGAELTVIQDPNTERTILLRQV